jgi:hypothetical protein
MATFIPNITDVFPKVSEYTPDFERIDKYLRLRQSMYDEGAKRIKTMYDSLFSSNMLREDNIKARDSYLKTISDSLNKIGAMDLSLGKNQEMANNLFTPILQDSSIVKDISYTKQLSDEMSKANSLLESSDLQTRKQYWEEGVKELEYKAEEFKNADQQTALRMSPPKYTPKVDVLGISEKLYKDAGISVKQDVFDGAYIWTKKNGDLVFPIAKNYVQNILSQDPAVKSMLLTQSYVERKDFIKQNAMRFGSEEKAERVYLEDILGKNMKSAQNRVNTETSEVKELRLKKESWDKIIRERGIVPGSDEHEKYLTDLEKLQLAEQGAASQEQINSSLQMMKSGDINQLRSAADNILLLSNFDNMTNEIAGILSTKEAESTVKVNPISLSKINADLRLQTQRVMESIRQANRIQMAAMRHQAAMEEIKERGKYTGGKGRTKKEKGKSDNKDLDLDDLEDMDSEDTPSKTDNLLEGELTGSINK